MMSPRSRSVARRPNVVVSSSTTRAYRRAQWPCGAARPHRGAHPPPRADRAARRRDLPRFRRAGLDLPLACARCTRLHRLRRAREPRGARSRIRRRRRLLPGDVRRGGDRGAAQAHGGRAPRPALPADGRSGTPRNRPHRIRPGGDGALSARGQPLDARDQAPPRGRRRPPAPLGLARGDGGLLRRERPRDPDGLHQPGHPPRPDPHRDPSAAAASAPCGRGEHPAARRRAPPAAAGDGGDTARAARLPRRLEDPRPRPEDPGRARVRHRLAGARGCALGTVGDRERRSGSRRPDSSSRRPRPRSTEAAGRVRRRQGAPRAARRLAGGRERRGGGCRGARDRGGCTSAGEAHVMKTELERAVGEILIDADTLRARIGELGEEVSAHYAGQDLLLIGVLKGAVFFMADLMRHLTVPCEVDFMAISSYGAQTDSSGVVRILKDLDINIEGRNVLVVEDIIDSGLTLSYLMRNLESREPASLEICALLTKPDRREIDVPVRWIGFEIPNRFVIGYGLDFAERYRNLPYVGVLSDELMPEGT